MAKTISLADYLFKRLRQIGVDSLFGVPGDYNLTLLDHVEPSGIHWVGNANELNAGYAADGYARIKGCGALVTTFGVGELSAINAIAGAYAERAPVVHIVGSPGRPTQEERRLVHHTFNDGEFSRFAKMYGSVTVANASLRDARTAAKQIDETLRECLLQSRPVYIDIPVDMVDVQVDAASLETDIEQPEVVSTDAQQKVLDQVMQRIRHAKAPIIVVDGETRSHRVVEEVESLVKTTGWPTWTTAFGKGLIDETIPNFQGIYQGSYDEQHVQDIFKSADLILSFGQHDSWTNTYAYITIPKPAVTISFADTAIILDGQKHRDICLKHILQHLVSSLTSQRPSPHPRAAELQHSPHPPIPTSGPLSQLHLWHALNPFLQPGDIVLGETGTSGHGCRQFHLPSGCKMFLPATWLSIGYMLPASLGAALAQRDMRSSPDYKGKLGTRTLLFIGDGSFQMTAQEMGTIIREGLDVVVFLVNNDGYTIERCIHGLREGYNDVARWRWELAPAFFGAEEGRKVRRVGTWEELKEMMEDGKVRKGKGLGMVELVLEREDAPEGPLKEMVGVQQKLAESR